MRCSDRWCWPGPVNAALVLSDATTLCFETAHEDDLRTVVGDHDQPGDLVAFGESLQHRDQGDYLGGAVLEAADLQREPIDVDHQPDPNLGGDLAYPDFR